MSDEKKRIINETTDTALASSGDYVIVDSQTEGTRKFDLGAALVGKVDTVSGKGLSTNDYTTEEKTKLEGIATGATNVTVDNTLSNSGQAADAKKTGDELSQLKEDLTAEETARENAISAEADAREAAVTAEAQTRSAADTTLGNDVQDLKSAMADAEADIENVLQTKAPVIINSATGQIATFSDGADGMNVKSLRVNMEPIQDLHGYDRPWPAGGGKNLANINRFDNLQWDNDTILSNGVTFKRIKNGAGQYIGISANGIATGTAQINVSIPTTNMIDGDILSGSIPGGRIYFENHNSPYTRYGLSDSGSEVPINFNGESPTSAMIILRFFQGANANGTFLPMIRHASESDATFEPYSNICPISGRTGVTVTRTGKNLWGGEKLANDILRLVSDSRIDQVYNSVYFTAQNVDGIDLFSNFKTDTQYTFILRGMNNSLSAKDVNLKVVYTDGTSEKLSFATAGVESYCSFTSAYNKSIKALMGTWQTSSTKLYYNKCGIFEGVLTEADFEPYQGQSVTVQLGQTVYGGTLDVTQGVLTANRAIVDLGTLDYTYQALSGPRSAFSVSISSLKPASGGWDFLPAISAIYSAKRYNDPWEDGDMSYSSSSGQNISFINNAYTDAASFKTAMDGVQLCYELATPITYTLTPKQLETVKGINHISANGNTTIDVAYCADTKLYIDQKLANAIANALNA